MCAFWEGKDSLKSVIQATCHIWLPSSSSFTKSKHHAHVEVRGEFVSKRTPIDFYFLRYIVQDPSTVCRGIRHALPRPALHRTRFGLQYLYEALLHREQLLYPLPYESTIQVCPHILPSHAFSQCHALLRPTQDPSIDTFRLEYLVGPSAFLALIFNYTFNFTEVLWAFSIYLEALAILPQLFMLQRTGEAEAITTHYLAALGAYRALYIPNWLYRYAFFSLSRSVLPFDTQFRYFSEGTVDPIAVVAGLVQTGLYVDFFYIYFTKLVPLRLARVSSS